MFKKIIATPFIQTVLVAALVAVAMLWPWGPLEHLENQNYDFWADRFHPSENQPIAIVTIDDKSLQQIGDWPWPRSMIARMVQLVSDQGAEAIGVCLLYTHPHMSPGLQEISALKEQVQDPQWQGGQQAAQLLGDLLGQAEQRLDQDAQLIAAVLRASNAVVPMRFLLEKEGVAQNEDLPGLLVINSIRSPDRPVEAPTHLAAGIRAIDGGPPEPVAASGVLETFGALAGKAGGMGHMNLVPDPDGRIRRLPLLIQYGKRLFPALALQLAIKYSQGNLRHLDIGTDAFGGPYLNLENMRLPTDNTYSLLLNHDVQWIRRSSYSFVDVLNGTVPPGAFKHKIVLIGPTSDGVTPLFAVGGSSGAATVEITADALAQILSPIRLCRPSWARLLEIVVLLYFAFMLMFLIPRVNVGTGAAILLLFLGTWYAVGVGALLGYGYRFKLLGPALLGCCGFVLIQFTTYSRKQLNERLDSNKTLGLSYQSQGMLDMAYEKYMLCPVEDGSVKNLLYSLGLDFERKRMFNKAVAIYQHIGEAGAFKDIKERITRLGVMENPMGLGTAGGVKQDATLVANGAIIKPTFGRYEILRELGRGAMGAVYLGRDPKINRKVAVKTLDYAEVETDELADVKDRFFREAQAAGQLTHPNIVSIYDAGEEHDMAYIAMELLIGDTLNRRCRPNDCPPLSETLRIISEVTAALDYAHNQGVVHRDIKPGNIMLLEDGRVKVTDFGIAQVIDSTQTRTGVILGTPSYMSPEQLAGKDVDGRSDLFSLGIVFYELLTGSKPFKGENISATLYAITHAAHPSVSEIVPDIPACCTAIVDKLLAKAVSKRFRSAAQAHKAIERCRAELQ
jgi:eukaryotic-like serine/threonine-protein kinase